MMGVTRRLAADSTQSPMGSSFYSNAHASLFRRLSCLEGGVIWFQYLLQDDVRGGSPVGTAQAYLEGGFWHFGGLIALQT
eukprot:5634306-Amphidinium_carterae.1